MAIITSLKTIKAAAGDYTSLSGWEAGEEADLPATSAIAVAECYAMSDTTGCLISNWVTDATHYIKIYTPTAERHDGKWNASKYRIEISASTSYCISVDDTSIGHVRMDGLQFLMTYNSGAVRNIYFLTDAMGRFEVSNCIMRNENVASSSSRWIHFASDVTAGSGDVFIWNSIGYGGCGHGIVTPGSPFLNGSMYIYNCAFSEVTDDCLESDGNDFTVINCAIFNNADDFRDAFTLIDFCASDDGDGTNAVNISPGGTEADDWNDAFTNYAAGDFHIKDTGSVLYNAGTNDPGSGLFSDDIDGDTRSTWDIGADEFVVVGGVIVPIVSYYYRKERMR